MALVMGVDPGANGALCVYDSDTNSIVSMNDMPVWYMAVGKTSRARIDAPALEDIIVFAKEILGVELVVIEEVNERPKQSGMFAFGFSVGLLYMACISARLPIETVPPATWKKLMRVPGKPKSTRAPKDETPEQEEARKKKNRENSKAADDSIVHRADELFPDFRRMWRGPQGGYKVDRAEAALLARFGADHVLRVVGTVRASDPEFRLAYRKAEVGA